MSNFFIICFDICDMKRLRMVSNTLGNFGVRAQRSLFECHLKPGDLKILKNRIGDIIDEDIDQVRYYPLCQKDVNSVIVDGPGEISVDLDYHMI